MITRVRGGQEVEVRSFALTDMVRYGYGGLRGITSSASEKQIRGLPALYRAARLRAEAIASLKLRCWRGEGATREYVTNVWQSALLTGPPNDEQTRFGFWETVGESLAWRGNAFIWKNTDPLTSRIIELYALHPDQVRCKPDDSYVVKVMPGYTDPAGKGVGQYTLDDSVILHIRGHGEGGTHEAPSPIQVFKEALQAPVERQKHETRMWKRGAAIQAAVVFPATTNRQQAEEWKESFTRAYQGTDGDPIAVLGGGAEIKPIGMTVRDAEFVAMAHLTVEDASRIMGVPANLLGAPTMTGTQRANLEEDLASWFRFGLGPELERIESALAADPQLFPALGRTVYPAFDTDAFVRGDLMTEATILQTRVQAGILTPDEARHILGLDPLPGGIGAIPQITPVGGAPNPTLKPTEPATPALN